MSARTRRAVYGPALPDYAAVFSALGDATRLKLVGALCAGGAMSITRLTACTAYTRQAITKHLGVLAGVGLVRGSKVGRERLWQFEPAPLDEARKSLEAVAAQWDSALVRLKGAVED